jgi:hypothetical protein
MLKKLTYISNEDPMNKKIANAFYGGENHFNKKPINWREISEAEFARTTEYVYDAYEFKQVPIIVPMNKEGTKMQEVFCSVHLYYLGNAGWATFKNYWAEKVQYFFFGCEHQFGKTETLGMHYHRYTCVKCGEVQEVYSSG